MLELAIPAWQGDAPAGAWSGESPAAGFALKTMRHCES
jgi:hypothetical protein